MGDFISFSQAGQDKFAYEHALTPGTFLDVGCNDPVSNSNSLALEQLGWKGILIDLDADMINLCKQRRTSPAILQDATTVDWAALCEEHAIPLAIDYLSLDVDGPEIEVLKNLFAAGLSFKVITCEHDRYHRGDGPRDAIRKFLLERGYVLAVPDVKVYDEYYPNGVEFEDWWIQC
jgi:hypothetical protein